VVLVAYIQDHIDVVSITWNLFDMDATTRLRDDAILRAAVEETLDLFGESIKSFLLLRLGLVDEDGNKIGSNEDSLDYNRIIEAIVQIFGDSGSRPILRHLDKKIEEHRKRLGA